MTQEKGTRIPQYRIIEQALEERIRTGAFSFDEPLCTESSLMEVFGSSRITVRRALEELEAKGFITRKRGIGCFVSRTAYDALRTSEAEPAAVHRQNAVYALICPENQKRTVAQAFFDGACEVFDTQEAHAVLYLSSSRAEERPAALLTRFSGMDIAGVVLLTDHADTLQSEINHLLLQGKAVAVCGGSSALPHVSSIAVDTVQASREMVGHLTALGHRRIAFFTGADEHGTAEHLLALTAHGILPESDLICHAGDAGALRRCITAGATVILAQTADILRQLERELTVLGRHIPGTMSLCCMEDCPPLPALRRGEAQRSVTCMRFSFKDAGRASAQRLLELKGAPIQPAQHILLPAKLHPGTTTAAISDPPTNRKASFDQHAKEKRI